MYTDQLDAIIESLVDLQVQMTAFSAIFSGGFFWFALFCVGVVLVLVAAMLYLFVDFFVHLFWRNK